MYTIWTGFSDHFVVWAPMMFFVSLWVFMQWHGRLPSTDSIQEFITMLNSRGGNILVLTCLSMYFFKYAVYLFFHLLQLTREGKITPDNAFALMAVQFLTTTAFGGFSGALLKTMTGESPAPARNGNGNGNGYNEHTIATTTTTVTATGGVIL